MHPAFAHFHFFFLSPKIVLIVLHLNLFVHNKGTKGSDMIYLGVIFIYLFFLHNTNMPFQKAVGRYFSKYNKQNSAYSAEECALQLKYYT